MENTEAVKSTQEKADKALYLCEVAKPVEVSTGKTVPFLDWLKRLAANLKEKGVASDATILKNPKTNENLEYSLVIIPGENYDKLLAAHDAEKKTMADFVKEGEEVQLYYRRPSFPAIPLKGAKVVWKLSKS